MGSGEGGELAPSRSLTRRSGEAAPVTNVELFFDLVYVFAVTQLSHFLLAHRTLGGALQAALLFALVWLAWIYTTWVTNWLDPERLPVRAMLVVLAFGSVIMAAALPQAFEAGGLVVSGAYAAIQIGRSAFTVYALRGEALQRNFQRIFVWCLVSGGAAIIGGVAVGPAREALWLGAVAVDLLGGAVGFVTPGLGRSTTAEWTVEGNHFAERCQAFVLIAVGESLVAIGGTLTGLSAGIGATAAAFVAGFAGCVGLWWIYFDRSAEAGAQAIAAAKDPGRLARSAYHFVHPVMVAGIIVTAAADEDILAEPLRLASGSATWLALGGVALFLIGHALFKVIVWRARPWSHLAALIVLALLGPLGAHAPAWALSAGATVVVVGVAIVDQRSHPAPS